MTETETIEDYLTVALAVDAGQYHGGFSKGTANVSPHDVKKLSGLLAYYAKKPHPFTACVKDNRKRFGDHTEQYCAVLKDIIVGNTKWRKGGHKKVSMSQEEIAEFELDIPENFWTWLSESDFTTEGEQVDLAIGDVAWNAAGSMNSLRCQIETQLNAGDDTKPEEMGYAPSFWVDDISGNEALVCAGPDHYVVPFSVDKDGNVSLSDEGDWKSVDQAWVESSANFSISPQIGAEMHLGDDGAGTPEIDSDGLIWKTILREGTWKMSPGPGQKPVAKPITVVKSGPSDGSKLVISMEELKNNFEAGVVEHVTIPTSHADKVHENTGFVKGLRFETDDKGREVLKAGMQFTEPDIKEKALRGTIANTSAGVLFDYVNKRTGKKSSAVLGHTALTNHPWLDDMNPFGVLASENVEVMKFSEEQSETIPVTETGGGEQEMPEATEAQVETTPKFLSDLGLSEAEASARLARYEELEAADRAHKIDAQVAVWTEANKAPGLVTAAKTLLSAANDTDTVLNLSEDGKTVGLTAVDVINRLMEAAPALTLAQDVVTDKEVAGDAPVDGTDEENAMANLSQEEKVLATTLFIGGMGSEEAIKEAKKRLKSE